VLTTYWHCVTRKWREKGMMWTSRESIGSRRLETSQMPSAHVQFFRKEQPATVIFIFCRYPWWQLSQNHSRIINIKIKLISNLPMPVMFASKHVAIVLTLSIAKRASDVITQTKSETKKTERWRIWRFFKHVRKCPQNNFESENLTFIYLLFLSEHAYVVWLSRSSNNM